MARKKVPITLPGVDDLFTSQGERDGSAMGGVSDIPLAAIDPDRKSTRLNSSH